MNDDRTPHRARVPRGLLLVTAGAVAAALVLALLVAPPDAVQGEAQRWMYLHVPAAWSAYLCFAVVLLASVALLATDRPLARRTARACAETGIALTALTLVTGSVWGALTWGTWWVWDARVTSTVALGLVYVVVLAALLLAATRTGRRTAGVLGVLGFLCVPLVHMSVVWWRTLHQPPTVLAPGAAPPVDPTMSWALAVAVLACTLVTATVVLMRVRALADTPDRGIEDPTGGHALVTSGPATP